MRFLRPHLSAAHYNETLNPRVRQWILTLFVPLGGMFTYASDDIVSDALLQALFDFDDADIELSKAELHSLLRKEYRKYSNKSAALPDVLQSNVAQLAKLVDLDSVERSILEFAVALSMDARLTDATDLLGELNTARCSIA